MLAWRAQFFYCCTNLSPTVLFLCSVATHPSYQNVYIVTVGSFNRALTLEMSGLAMNHGELRPQVLSYVMTSL